MAQFNIMLMSEKQIEIISHNFKTITQRRDYSQGSEIFNQPALMKAHLQSEPD